ncbi:hypothetical protein IQ07DRAFT_586122 [Pyrenochaeta sp. DS3sAY3a]|nr:hypothetical protein IQ07DRAFT_586122 [Pyrenochaeta sp. DS3sAY3a]
MAHAHNDAEQPIGHDYKYDPLVGDHDIRLLKVDENPGSINRLSGTLVHHSLDEFASESPSFSYHAISYAWGDPTSTDRLWLSHSGYLEINASAAYVLRHVTTEKLIWIDSVCINQNDTSEKSTQLRYMWGIYKFAEEVLAWPGGAEDGGDLAMELLFDISFALITKEITGRTPVYLPTSSVEFLPGNSVEFLPGTNTTLWKKSRPPLPRDFQLDRERWGALARFLNRSWWNRAWVIQEIVAAGKLTICVGAGSSKRRKGVISWKLFNDNVCGYTLEWRHLVDTVKHLECYHFLYLLELAEEGAPCDLAIVPAAITCIQRVNALKPARDDQRPDFQDNLLLTKGAEATNPKDKVFAIGSMSYGSLTKELYPHYELPVEDVYINATKHLLIRDQYLMTLHMAGIGWRRKLETLPSWVPDFSTTRRSGTRRGDDFVLGGIASNAGFAALSDRWWRDRAAQVKDVKSRQHVHSIQILGLIIDDIEVVCRGLSATRSIRKSMNSENWIDRKVIRSWLDMVSSQVCPDSSPLKQYLSKDKSKPNRSYNKHPLSPAPLSDDNALASVLIMGSSYDGKQMGWDMHTPLASMYQAFILCVKMGVRPCDLQAEPVVANGLNAYIDSLDRVPNWTVFRTSSGYIGRGAPLVKKGDKVCCFEGARTPFVIRKAVVPWSSYHLVGECYVEGLMSREAERMSVWKWRFISLC